MGKPITDEGLAALLESNGRIEALLIQIRDCLRSEREVSAESDARFDALLEAWNSLPKDVAPNCRKITKAISAKWEKVLKDEDARPLFDDPAAVAEMAAKSTYCHRKNWFVFAWLFGKGQDGEWNIVKLMDGRYTKDDQKGNGQGSLFDFSLPADTTAQDNFF